MLNGMHHQYLSNSLIFNNLMYTESQNMTSLFFLFFLSSITAPQGGNCIPSAKYWVEWEALFILPITALSRSTRGTHFQVMSKGTNFD